MSNEKAKIDELKAMFDIKTDEELAEKLGVSVYAVRNWKQRDSLPKKYEVILIEGKNTTISNNANSVIVNGANHAKIVNGSTIEISDELMEFVGLFKEYGNAKMLTKFKTELLKIKEVIDG